MGLILPLQRVLPLSNAKVSMRAERRDGVIGQTVSHYKITEKLGEGGMGFGRTYDLSRDGECFLVWLEPDNPPAPSKYHVILNWGEELQELVPTER